MKKNSLSKMIRRQIKWPCRTLFVAVSLLLVSSCKTYYIAATSAPADMYADNTGTEVTSSLPVNSVILVTGKEKNGFIKARYHTNTTWYWVSTDHIFYIPNTDPKYYSSVYANIESKLATSRSTAGTADIGYDATIQEGSRGGKYYINKNGKKTYVPRSTSSGSTKHVGGKGSRGGKP